MTDAGVRDDGEVKVYCKDCNGYLWSDDRRWNQPQNIVIACPYKAGRECQPRRQA